MPRKLPFFLCALTFSTFPSPTLADITLVSLNRTLSVTADTPSANAFTFERSFNTAGAINEALDGFGFIGNNFLAGSTTQRSTIHSIVTRGVSTLLQGSAALVGSISDAAPLDARAISSVSYTFAIDTATQIRLIWSLEGRGLQHPIAPLNPASLVLFENSDIPTVVPLLEQAVAVSQVNDGSAVLALNPGTYTLSVGAYTRLTQGNWPGITGSILPADATQSAGYSVFMTVVPAPPAALPLAIAVGGLAARRRRA